MNQLNRRNINNYVRSKLALGLEEDFKEKAKDNKRIASRQSIEVLNQVLQKSAEPESKQIKLVDTRQELAKIANVSHDTIAKVKVIEQKAKPELKAKLEIGEVSINEGYHEVKREEVRERVKQSVHEPVPLPIGEYNVIIADPPWKYEFVEADNRAIENHYPTMGLQEICNLQIPAADNSILFMWATAPKLEEAIQVMNSWNLLKCNTCQNSLFDFFQFQQWP